MEHQIKDGDFINIIGNTRNKNHPIKVVLNYKIGDKIAEPFICAMAVIICSDTNRNFGKHSVQNIDVNYGDILKTERGDYKLIKQVLSDGELVKI